VIEMGMSEPGEIAHLASLAAPNAALITNAGHAHLERFHTVEAIANEKAALARALRPNDVVFAGADSAPLLKALEGVRCRRVTYGLSSEADVRPRTLERLADGTSRLEVEGFPEFTLPLVGAHQAGNALGALAVAKEYGVAPADAVAAIVAYRPAKGRMEVWRVSGATLLVDCYNANPDSTAAALETLANLPGARRRIAILGDMLELGSRAGELHRETGALVQRAELWTVGAFARDWALGAKRAGAEARIFDDVAGVRDALREALAPGVVVLVKGSRGAALERVLEGLELES
jgi:UDP-N-acetylmuramoyl-tripeptide--D-alanyl-D-alanine ligase